MTPVRSVASQVKLYALIAVVTIGALALLLLPTESQGTSREALNAIALFALLGVLSDSSFLKISFANVSTSVGFVPFIASVALFEHPWPMLIAGLTAVIVDTFVRHKPAIRVWFNTAQFMLATGASGLVYTALGGHPNLTEFKFSAVPFAGLVVTFFVVNQGSVALAVAFSNGVSVRESWDRIGGGGARIYDLFASSLAVLLVFLFTRLQAWGVAILVLPLFFVRQLYQMNLQLQEELQEKLELMVKAIEARDPYTSGHSRRVAEYASTIARELGLSAKDVDNIKTAALLHDVGKIYEEFAPLLRKEDRLTPEERIVMQTHVVRSAELVGTVSKLKGVVLETIRHHHERYDGAGYPDGFAGETIPIGARIIMISDTIDAMTTDRPYRRALTLERALDELGEHAGSQFDPRLVDLVRRSPAIQRLLGSQSGFERVNASSVGSPPPHFGKARTPVTIA